MKMITACSWSAPPDVSTIIMPVWKNYRHRGITFSRQKETQLLQKVLYSCFLMICVCKPSRNGTLIFSKITGCNYEENFTTREFATLEGKRFLVLTCKPVITHMCLFDTRASVPTSCIERFSRAPAVLSTGEGGRDVLCSAACWLIMGRELLLGWPGRVLEPVGLAQGGLATDPGGDGMKSGTSQNTSPGFGAFLTFPPPKPACLYVYETKSKNRKCAKDATGFYILQNMDAIYV